MAFVRDPRTTVQVWSRDQGYPGEPHYLEFHKKHFPGGFRYWRVTGSGVDLGDKALYEPATAAERVQSHADHFLALIQSTLTEAARETGGAAPLVVSPYDAELFGHWWFEGPAWLEAVARRMAANGVKATTLAEVVDRGIPPGVTTLQEGSWGEAGDHRVWLNRETEWTWDRVYDVEQDLVEHVRRLADGHGSDLYRRVVSQACREALLLQASDWQFLITTLSARDYAERRFAEHYTEFKRLLEMADKLTQTGALGPEDEEVLRRLERDDFPFPDLDPTWALGADHARRRRMRRRVLAFIMAGGKGERLSPLTRERSKPAVPFAGRYRVIDFVLSNFVNSGILSLYVLVQYKSQSLIEHLRVAWRSGGLVPDHFVTVVPPQMRMGEMWYRGTADAVLQNLHLLDDHRPDLVAIFGADHVYRMDVNQMIDFHTARDACVTVAALPVPVQQASGFGVIGVDGESRIVAFDEKPRPAADHPRPSGPRLRLDGQLPLRPGHADRGAAGGLPPLDRARLRAHDHPGAGPRRPGLRLRLPGQRGAGTQAPRGARVLARHRAPSRATGGPTWTCSATRRGWTSTTRPGRSWPAATRDRPPASSAAPSRTRSSARGRSSATRRCGTPFSAGAFTWARGAGSRTRSSWTGRGSRSPSGCAA